MTDIIYIVIPAYNPNPIYVDLIQELADKIDSYSKIVIVNDGSTRAESKLYFESVEKIQKVILLQHDSNQGKGKALKTAFSMILDRKRKENIIGVVTADADGQHLVEDILLLYNYLKINKHEFILGRRIFAGNIPIRSRFGNILTCKIMSILLKRNIQDTQTGLRGIPIEILPDILHLKSNRYEFETEVLIKVARRYKITEIPINTIYLDNNKSSHFNPIKDSISIYFTIIRHAGNSLITALIDYLVFIISYIIINNIIVSLILSRLVAGSFNFYIGKKIVFKSYSDYKKELLLYIILVVFLTSFSYFGICLFTLIGFPIILGKVITELFIFVIAFIIQQQYIFNTNRIINKYSTDWELYYSKDRLFSSPFRRVTEICIFSIIKGHIHPPVNIIEFGGGDSFFYPKFKKRGFISHYTIVDKSQKGCSKFHEKYGDDSISTFCIDLFHAPQLPHADFVYSVGLIEHFSVDKTSSCILEHFKAANTEGCVLLTFPTPTLLYRIIRHLAELLHIWRFPDERPLAHKEVAATIEQYGFIIDSRINWWIGLTQEIILAKKYLND